MDNELNSQSSYSCDSKIPDFPPPTYKESIGGYKKLPKSNPKNSEIEIVDKICLPDFSTVNNENVKKILYNYSLKNKLSQSAIRKMLIVNINHEIVQSYTLETFIEYRTIASKYRRYEMGRLDDESMGKIPEIWEFDYCKEPINYQVKLFEKNQKDFVLPHSEYVQPCHICRPESDFCFKCGGNGKLKYYMNCNVVWLNHKDEYFSKTDLVPASFLSESTGECVYEFENQTVNPVKLVQNKLVKAASFKFIKGHKEKSMGGKMLRQRHSIRMIPIWTVHYIYQQKASKFYIFGNDHRLHIPSDFPRRRCSIM